MNPLLVFLVIAENRYIAKTLYGTEEEEDASQPNSRVEEPKLLGVTSGSYEKVLLKSGPYGVYVQLGEDRKGYIPKRASVSHVCHISIFKASKYETWEVQDQKLLVWQLSTLLKSVLSRVLGSNSYQVWNKIHEYFSLHTKSRARQLRTAMRAVTLDEKSIDEYLRKVKGYVDELAGVGVPVRHEEYVDALLEGLPSDYAPVISVIESKKRTPSIAEIKALLYGHETRLTRYNRDT
ncbi:Retrovirus-related Pol polyprotein from transposon RE1 [Glycine soja]|uniref:Retrovirus-related Pol polyprotein from transposon RE1 n=1 Tax=Glycine soja TaxID=3848 RepID=A0A445G941_GLYSO|nr:Retrovirus-related Pol polyprotein from transposon RE1 [Glycine soja]